MGNGDKRLGAIGHRFSFQVHHAVFGDDIHHVRSWRGNDAAGGQVQDDAALALAAAFISGGEADEGLAASVGFDWGQVALYLGSNTDVQKVKWLEVEVRVAGIDIVPFYIFNGKVSVSGAHEVEVLLEAIAQATTNDAPSVVE